jgi:Ca2+-binding RTX toxin-like protein
MANFTGTSANDTFNGTEANDTAIGNGGNDTLNGNGGDDTLRINGTGTSTADGGAGNDTLTADGGGTKTLLGGDGDDQFFVDRGAGVSIVGGEGVDTLHLYATTTTIDLSSASIAGVEAFNGGSASETVTLNFGQFAQFSTFDGGGGTDKVNLQFAGTADISDNAGAWLDLVNVEELQVAGGSGDNTLTVSVEQFNRVTAFNLYGGTDSLNVEMGGTVDFTTRFPALSGVEFVHLSGTGSVRMNVAQFAKFTSIAGDIAVTVADTGARLKLYTPAQLAGMSARVDILDATDDALALNVAQFRALGPIVLTSGDVVTLADTGGNLATLTAAELISAAAAGVDKIDATNNALSLTVEQYRAVVAALKLTAADVVTLADTGANLATLSPVEIADLAANFVDKLDSTDGSLALSIAQAMALSGVTLTAADVVTVAGSGAEIALLTIAEIGKLATKGVDRLDATDNAITLTKGQALALGTIKLGADDVVVVADTSSRLIEFTAAQIADLSIKGVDRIDATNGTLTLTAEQYNALGNIVLTTGDVVTLRDTGVNIGALSASAFQALVARGVDKIDVKDNPLTINLARAATLTPGLVTPASVVILSDGGGALSAMTAADIATLAGKGVDQIDSSNGQLTFSVAQYLALGSVVLTTDDMVTLSDTGAALEALSVAQLAALAGKGVDRISVSDNALSLSLAKLQALGTVALGAANVVTLTDTSAVLSGLSVSDLGALAGKGIDRIDSTSNALTLSMEQVLALGAVTLAAADVVTMTATGAQIAALTPSQIGGLVAKGLDQLDATDDVLTLSAAQFVALGTAKLAAGDLVVLADTGAALAGLTAVQFAAMATAGIDRIDASNDGLVLSVAQYLGLGSVLLTAGDTVTLRDTGANIAALPVTAFQSLVSKGVDKIDATDDVLVLTVARAAEVPAGMLTAADMVTLADTGASIGALSAAAIAALAGKGIDRIDATDDVLSLTLAQYQALGTVVLVAADVVTLADTGANIGALSASAIAALAGKGIDRIDATDNVLSLSVSQFQALGGVTLTAADVVTVTGTGDELSALTSTQLSALAASGVDHLDSTGGQIRLNKAQALALGTVTLTPNDQAVLKDTAAQIAALTPAQIASLAAAGFDDLYATNASLVVTAAQYGALGNIRLASDFDVILRDTGANIAALSVTDFQAFSQRNIGKIDATDNVLSLTMAQADRVSEGMLTAADMVTLADTGENIGSSLYLARLPGLGVDRIDATDDVLSLTVTQYQSVGNVALTTADMVTLRDSAGNIELLSTAQLSALAGKGVDKIDALGALSLTLAKVQALGAVELTSASNVTVTDTAANLQGYSAAQFAALAAKGVDRIDSTNNTLSLTAAQVQALGTVQFTAADVVTLADTGANIAALTPSQLSGLAGRGIDAINAINDALTLTVAQYRALGAVTLTAADYVILRDTSANLATLTPAENAALAGKGIDEVQSEGGGTIETALSSYTLDAFTSNLKFIGTGSFTGTGNDLANTITGGDAADTLSGLGGNDTLIGGGGDDVLIGGLGADVLNGGVGSGDYASYRNATAGLTVSLANPSVNTGEAVGDTYIGIERLEGSAFNDTLIGNASDNTLRGGAGADAMDGGAGFDYASYYTAGVGVTASLINPGSNTGDAAGDTYVSIEGLGGSKFDDNLTGDAGDNWLVGREGADVLNGGAGADYASYEFATAGLTVSLANPSVNTGEAAGDTYVSIERISGSAFNDTLIGDAGANTLRGGLGADVLNGGAGADYASYAGSTMGITASLANSTVNTGEAAGDTYISIESLSGSNFDDILIGDAFDNTFQGNLGADQIDGGGGFDYASYFNATTGVTASLANSASNTGEAAGDTYANIEGLTGSAFADVLTGNGGDNWLLGGLGADQLDGGLGFDVAAYGNATAGVTASLANPSANTGEAAGDTYTSIEGLSGSALNDILIGDGGNNVLRGQGGADQLDGGAGIDTVSYQNASSGVTATLNTSAPYTNTGDAAGDIFISIENLSGSTFADLLIGDSGNNFLYGSSGADILFGGAGNDTFYGNSTTSGFDGSVDRVDYSPVTGLSSGISVNWLAGTVTGQAGIIDTDQIWNIEAVYGTSLADTFDATGFSSLSSRVGDFSGYQLVRGGGGNDTIIGNGSTDASYSDATSGVTVTLSLVGNTYTGTATGGGVGTDSLTNVGRFVGSLYNDVFWGTNNAEIFDGFEGGDDVFHGGGGTDMVEYDGATRMAIDVQLAAGIVTGRVPGSNIGTDTLDSIERIRGSELDDRFDATGFSNLSTNAGSNGNFNRFEGQGGADLVIGNGNTYLDYFNATGGITVTLNGQGSGIVVATYGSNTATDTFTGVGGINGGNGADTFNGGAGFDNFFGQFGTDVLNGGAGDDILEGGGSADTLNGGSGFDFASYRNAGSTITVSLVTGGGGAFTTDATGDQFNSIEGLIGSNFNDSLTGDAFGNILNGGLGADTLNGGTGDHAMPESPDAADYASYINSQSGVTVSLFNPGLNTGEAAGDTFTNINGLIGSHSNDTLTGSDLYGDYFIGNGGNDTIDGRLGFDTARYDNSFSGVWINLGTGIVTGGAGQDTLISIEGIWGSHFADTYDASGYTAGTPGIPYDDYNSFEGFGGADTIIGTPTFNPSGISATSISYMHATAGITVNMSGAAAGSVIATYTADTSTDTFSNVNTVAGSYFNDTFNGTSGAQAFNGGGGDDLLYGGADNDSLSGGEGSDQLYGGSGDDFLEGGPGADILDGGDGIDMVSYYQYSASGGVTASLENALINTGDAAGDTYVSIENLAGTFVNDTLIGTSGNNIIDGVYGADVFNGRGGMDTLIGNGGGDTFVFNSAIGAGNLATIVGYAHGQDHFNLDNAIFTQLGADGALSAGAFVNGTAALDANDRIIFNSTTGTVSYDADGSGAGAAVVFATMQQLTGGSLNHTDFLIV